MVIVNMHEAKSNLSRLVERAEAGEEIIIGRDGKPAVILKPVRSAGRLRSRGILTEPVDIDAFDALDEAIAAEFEGSDLLSG
jgi:prevent-host-death family protein